MSVTYFTSDYHLGHRNLYRMREKEDGISVYNHDELIFDNFASIVKPRDVTWMLGDMIVTRDSDEYDYYLQRIDALPGRKKLILGNHDTDGMAVKDAVSRLGTVFEEIHGAKKFKHVWLTHIPVHQDERRGRANIHGHTHRKSLPHKRYFSVCLEVNDYKPVAWQGNLQEKTKES